MTRQDYVMIASAIRDSLPDEGEAFARRMLRQAADFIADGCKADNPRFDRKRFLTACGFSA